MTMGADTGWIVRATQVCARSAAAYEAALLMAADVKLERSLIDRCRARYTTLERLLMALGSRGADAGIQRATLPRAASQSPPYGCLDEALAAAQRLDRLLTTLVQPIGGQVEDPTPLSCAL